MTIDIRPCVGVKNSCVKSYGKTIPWLWEGVLAEEAVTLLSAPEKIGKTTLLSLLLDRRCAGGELLGRTVVPGSTIVCSEESKSLWALRQPPLDFGPRVLFHQPLGPIPTRGRWNRFMNDVYELCDSEDRYDLVVIDTAINFLPILDRNKRTLRWAIASLRDLADLPTSVLIVNQSRNVHRPLAASADIVIEMTIPRGQERTRRRTFTGVGRYPDTLQTATADLNADGTDYVLQLDDSTPQPTLMSTAQAILAASATPLTSRELVARWPGAPPRPDSLWRILARGVELGLFTSEGAGTKAAPFRFGMAKADLPGTNVERH